MPGYGQGRGFRESEILPSTYQDTHRRFVNQKNKKIEGLCQMTESLSCSWSFFSRFPRKGDAMALSGIAAKSHPVIAALDTP